MFHATASEESDTVLVEGLGVFIVQEFKLTAVRTQEYVLLANYENFHILYLIQIHDFFSSLFFLFVITHHEIEF